MWRRTSVLISALTAITLLCAFVTYHQVRMRNPPKAEASASFQSRSVTLAGSADLQTPEQGNNSASQPPAARSQRCAEGSTEHLTEQALKPFLDQSAQQVIRQLIRELPDVYDPYMQLMQATHVAVMRRNGNCSLGEAMRDYCHREPEVMDWLRETVGLVDSMMEKEARLLSGRNQRGVELLSVTLLLGDVQVARAIPRRPSDLLRIYAVVRCSEPRSADIATTAIEDRVDVSSTGIPCLVLIDWGTRSVTNDRRTQQGPIEQPKNISSNVDARLGLQYLVTELGHGDNAKNKSKLVLRTVSFGLDRKVWTALGRKGDKSN